VLVSALNEELARTDARYGIDVFWKGFLANRGGYRVGIPSVPLGELYEGCRDGVIRRGGQVRLRCGVRSIAVRENRFAGAMLEDGTEITADACVLAVPHDAALGMLPQEMAASGGPLEALRHIRTSPITGVHLWFDRAVMTEPFLTLLDHTTQWVFNKSLLYAPADPAPERADRGSEMNRSESGRGQYLQLVISASYDLVPRSRREIIDLCRRELADVLPATREAKLEKAAVIKEVNATFSPAPGVDRWRPTQETCVRNLFLAGDWTRTGWPATMEGAVRSGYLAAEALMASLRPAVSPPQKFLQPGLPFEGLSKIWAKRRERAGP
jgi:zeta-carotene desaturase